MRRWWSGLVGLGVGALWTSSVAMAWGDAGHRLVCEAAWDSLSAEAQPKLLDILDEATPEAFTETCAWADAYRADYPESAAWHTVSIPKGASRVVMERDCPPERRCIIHEIERNFAILKSGAPQAERATALKVLAHLVGDLHQPLNVGYAEDAHGGLIDTIFFGKPRSLRDIWEHDLVVSAPPPAEKMVNRYRPLPARNGTFAWIEAPPIDWANESLVILRTPSTGYVGNPGGLAFDELYVLQNRSVVMDQIARAGVRLGHLLEQALKLWP